MDLIFIALTLLNTPYQWAGNDPSRGGVDCSGGVCHCMRAIGHIGKEDLTAQMLYDRFMFNRVEIVELQRNDLLFFGKDTDSITHVAIAYDGNYMWEVGGGDSKTIDKGSARIRPIFSRKDLVAAVSL